MKAQEKKPYNHHKHLHVKTFPIIKTLIIFSQGKAIPLSAGGKGKEIWDWE